MSKGSWITPDIIQRVKEINEEHPRKFCHEIAKYVGISDSVVAAILRDEYRIEGDKVVRLYKNKKPKKTEKKTKSQVTLKDIYDELKQIREAITDIKNMLKYSFKG